MKSLLATYHVRKINVGQIICNANVLLPLLSLDTKKDQLYNVTLKRNSFSLVMHRW